MSILPKNVTFICVGNICRSPVAEYYSRFLATQSQFPEIKTIQFDSAGINGGNMRLAKRSRVFLESKGIDTLNFHSKEVSKEYFQKFDLILVMEEYMKSYIIKYYFNHEDPAEKSKIALKIYTLSELGNLANQNITDPYLESDKIYDDILIQIQTGCANLLKKWENLLKSSWYKKSILQMRHILGFRIFE